MQLADMWPRDTPTISYSGETKLPFLRDQHLADYGAVVTGAGTGTMASCEIPGAVVTVGTITDAPAGTGAHSITSSCIVGQHSAPTMGLIGHVHQTVPEELSHPWARHCQEAQRLFASMAGLPCAGVSCGL